MDDKYNEQLLIQTVNYISHLLGIDPIKNDDPETLHYTWADKDGDCLTTAIFSFTIKNRETDLDCWVVLDCLPLKDTRDRNFLLHSSLTKENEKEIYEWLTPAMDKIHQKTKNSSSNLLPELYQGENLFVTVDPNQLIPTPENLNITTLHTHIPMDKTYHIIQAKIDGKWQDVLFSRGLESSASKKARNYRNKHGVETRVVRIIEHRFYTYDYALEETYKPNKE